MHAAPQCTTLYFKLASPISSWKQALLPGNISRVAAPIQRLELWITGRAHLHFPTFLQLQGDIIVAYVAASPCLSLPQSANQNVEHA